MVGNIVKLIIVIAVLFAFYGVLKHDPEGLNVSGGIYGVPASSAHFFEDLTYVDDEEVRYSEQEIFDEIFRMISGAHHYILIDMFLFNDFLGTVTGSHRQLSEELTNALIKKKEAEPNVTIVLITDPINTIYGGYTSEYLERLKSAGIEVVVTELRALRDSNPIFSGFWRAYMSWFGNSPKPGLLPNPFDERFSKVSVRSYAALLNFKANHRKVILADRMTAGGLKFSTLITSANPHDGSSAHTNTALRIDDFVWKDVLKSELAVAAFSNVAITPPSDEFLLDIDDQKGSVKAQILTEERIRDTLIHAIEQLHKDDTLDIAMFYLSERKVIQAIKDASNRRVKIRILLDPNKDAFGREKNGIPNRQVGFELKDHKGSIDVRWCDTHGEQCHTKLILMRRGDTRILLEGSANITRRNIGGFNLETDVYIESDVSYPAYTAATAYFEKVWNNEGGKIFSVDYAKYAENSYFKSVLYRLMEDVGTSSF